MPSHGVAGVMTRLDAAGRLTVERNLSGCWVRLPAALIALSPVIKDVPMKLLTLFALLMLAAISTVIAWLFSQDVSVIAPWAGTAGLVLLVLAAFWALR